jgi:hypothetical protein
MLAWEGRRLGEKRLGVEKGELEKSDRGWYELVEGPMERFCCGAMDHDVLDDDVAV